jgi:AraC-like DNA-binding protein
MAPKRTTSSALAVQNYRRVAGAVGGILPVFDGLSVVDVRAPYIYGRHQHLGFEIIAVDRSRYRCTLNGCEERLRPGEILIVKPGDWHQDFCTPPLRYITINCHLDHDAFGGNPPGLFAADATADHQRVRDSQKTLWPLLGRLRQESQRRDRFAAHLQDALLLEFFWRLVRALPSHALSPRFLAASADQGFITNLQRLFHQHLSEPLAVAAMARALHLGESTLAHRCQMLLGVSPARAFLRSKIERARRLLADTGMTIKEISAYLGFQNPYHFSKAFKRCAGVAPAHYRSAPPPR